ncbi:2-iminoacetate synthase ThiH [Clostridium sp. BJN0001]|uniref:2-iminoacetate synthase ThiH n=1 Tax=Clostridium sp. BJN0001 TaxID=2930219 RepID=UPI001FD60503|nr:2-iminoacetate synthase ThiH [Clostridium sp. BJN0001]
MIKAGEYLENSFYNFIQKYKDFDFDAFWKNVTINDIKRAIYARNPGEKELMTLLSPLAGEKCLEEMAQRSRKLTLKHFGKAVYLYTPMYIANYCINRCAYCGYNNDNTISRLKLNMEQIEKECQAVSKKGFKQILFLTGESPKESPVSYLVEATKVLRKYFPSVAIEVYPMDRKDYKKVVKEGVDSLTVFQETYDPAVYDKVHLGGPKKDYRYRLETPERGIESGIRFVNIGALLGLTDWRREMFKEGLHASFLQKKYPASDIGLSFSRIRPCSGGLKDLVEVTDRNLVQCITAIRIVFPQSVLNISTREGAGFRDKLIPIGINKISAESLIAIGGHSMPKEKEGEVQFDTNDKRTTEEIKQMIYDIGYQPIFKDWDSFTC